MTGTLINVATILFGGAIGVLLGNRLPERARQTVMAALGLMTLVLGMKMALQTQNILIVMFSVLLGGVIGEGIGLEARMNALGDWLQRRLAPAGSEPGRFSEGFVTATIVFCVGPLAVLGAIQDGLLGNYELLAIKSILDGFAAMAFAAAMGWGVLVSAGSILLYQGGISLAAMAFAGSWTGVSEDAPAIVEFSATGGVLILTIGLMLLDIKRLRIANYLPALALAPLTVELLRWAGVM
jgi:uncharacterized membrane protein YqgA involved in biofilm formation